MRHAVAESVACGVGNEDVSDLAAEGLIRVA